jgi:hypothetical protein
MVTNGTDPANADTDGEEAALGTDPLNFDTDGDLLPDWWEIQYGIDPLTPNDASSLAWDADGDGLGLFDEYRYCTSPVTNDTDGDLILDGVEIPHSPGSCPNDASDGGNPTNCVTVLLTVGDPSGSSSERWTLDVFEQPSGRAVIHHCDDGFGTPGSKEYALVKGKTYTFKLRWVATDPDYEGFPSPDFDWRCLINDSTAAGAREGLYGTGAFVVEDPGHLLTDYTDGGNNNLTIDKEGTIIVPKIVTETVATSPSDRTRKTVGVGESVKIKLLPIQDDSVTWQLVSGSGVLVAMDDGTAYYTAPDLSTNATIIAEYKSISFSVSLKVVQPAGVLFEHKVVTRIDQYPLTSCLGGECQANIFIQPDTVNFYALALYESGSFLFYDGCFNDFSRHSMREHTANGPHAVTSNVEHEKGSLCSVPDNYGGAFMIETNDNGVAYWELDWSYTVNEGEKVFIERLKQNNSVATTNTVSTWTTTKDAAGFRISSGDSHLTIITPIEEQE